MVCFRKPVMHHVSGLMVLPGGGELKPVANLSHQSELGSRKLEGSIKFITCGNTRQ